MTLKGQQVWNRWVGPRRVCVSEAKGNIDLVSVENLEPLMNKSPADIRSCGYLVIDVQLNP